jgi:Kef-type K+ transport system membrane component KefB
VAAPLRFFLAEFFRFIAKLRYHSFSAFVLSAIFSNLCKQKKEAAMHRLKNTGFYIVVMTLFAALMVWFFHAGKSLEHGQFIVNKTSDSSIWNTFIQSLGVNFGHPLAILLLQIVTIILVAKLFGWICTKIGQPTVIGEIVAGVVLGPSVIGHFFPQVYSTLFPVASLGNLQFISQIGLILFMFMVGMELDLKVVKKNAGDAFVISQVSIIVPFALGLGLAYAIYTRFAPAGVPFTSFGLFIGIAMSITAFPVLARVVQERGLHKTHLGSVVITCAAVDDITAWCLLAAVIAIVKAGSFASSIYVIALAILYVVVMIKGVRPFLKRVGDLHASRENLSKPIVAIFFLVLLLSSYATELIGIHALFGAFMAGTMMPDNEKFRNIFIEKIEDIALVLLLPLYFVFTGLRTQIGLLNDLYLWQVTGGIVAVAIIGKFAGSAIAARFVGQNWRNSLSIGALMNTRGLMELVVLNIGYDLGVLSPSVFAMMVIMALVTTFITGPALDLINKFFKPEKETAQAVINYLGKYKILVSFAHPDRSIALLRLAYSLTRRQSDNSLITAMHLSPNNDLNQFNAAEYEEESFAPIVAESGRLRVNITTLFKASNDIEAEITQMANKGNYDLLLIGIGQSIFEGSILGRILGFTSRIINPDLLLNKVTRREKLFESSPFDEKTRMIISKSEVPVGIFIDKNFMSADRVMVVLLMPEDAFLIGYAQKLIANSESQVTVVDSHQTSRNTPLIKETIRQIEQIAPNHIQTVNESKVTKELIHHHDLLLISSNSWKLAIERESRWLKEIPSTLILKS